MSGHGTMRRAFENGYLRGRIAGISFAEEENRSRIDSLMSGEAAALERVAELELCIACEVEIAFDIACEAESASAGESAALERVAILQGELSDALERVADLQRANASLVNTVVELDGRISSANKDAQQCYKVGREDGFRCGVREIRDLFPCKVAEWASPFVDRVISDIMDGLE